MQAAGYRMPDTRYQILIESGNSKNQMTSFKLRKPNNKIQIKKTNRKKEIQERKAENPKKTNYILCF